MTASLHAYSPPRAAARRALGAAVLMALSACSTVPPYRTPTAPVPETFKEASANWAPATPADGFDRGPWWEVFGDPVLNRLAEQVQLSNQNIAESVAAYLVNKHGILAERLSAIGKGSSEPLNKVRGDAPENRRVTIVTTRN